MNESVFIERQYCLSASGPTTGDLIADYETGRRPLREYDLADDLAFGPIRAGLIAQENLDLKEPLENSANSSRLIAGLEKIIAQIGCESRGRPFDAVIVAHGRIKHFNPRAIESDLMGARSLANLQTWITRQMIQEGVGLANSENVYFVDGTCSSGLQAVDMAWKRVRRGLWARVLLLAFDPYSFVDDVLLRSLGVVSTSPLSEAPKVFHCQRDGFVKAECFVATIVTSSRGEDRPTPRFQIRGSAVGNDANSLTATHPTGLALKECVLRALRLAEVGPEQIAFVKAHGTGTVLSDRVEAKVIHEIFGRRTEELPVVSFKSQFGHATNASGLLELILMVNCLDKERVKGVPLSQPVDPSCKLAVPSRDLYLASPRFALAISLGFGGINASLVLEKI